MEREAVRADLIVDNMPNSMTGKGPQKLVYLVISAFGLTLIALGIHDRALHQGIWVGDLCITLGVAVAAPGLLSYLYRRYLLDDVTAELQKPAEDFKNQALKKIDEAAGAVFERLQDKTESLVTRYEAGIELLGTVKSAGIYRVCPTRREAFSTFRQFVAEEPRDVLIIGSSLRGLLQEPDNEYDEIRKLLLQRRDSRVQLRFLLTHPKVADLRAQQENRRPKDIGLEIIGSLRILIDDWKIPRDDIKLYQGTPTCFGIKTGKAMLLNMYPYMKEAYASPCLIVLKEGYCYDAFDASHFKAWSSATAQAVPSSLSQLEDRLDEFAVRTHSLMMSTNTTASPSVM